MFFLKDFLPEKLKPNKEALAEDQKLQKRCITSSFEKMQFNFFVINIRSLSKHLDDLKVDMYAKTSDHVCVVETWIDPKQFYYNDFDHDTLLQGRTFDHASIGRGKGVGIFSSYLTKNCTTARVVENSYQIMSIIDKNLVQFILCYLSSRCQLTEVAQQLEMIIKPDMMTIISGDFNFEKDDTNPLTKSLRSKGFCQLVNQPTHDKGGTLDHCYASKDISDKIS